MVTLAAILVAVASRLGWSGRANVLTATTLTLFTANPPQAARDIILRGFPREVVFTAPGLYAHNRYDAYVLQAGDQVTAVVVDDGLHLPADAEVRARRRVPPVRHHALGPLSGSGVRRR